MKGLRLASNWHANCFSCEERTLFAEDAMETQNIRKLDAAARVKRYFYQRYRTESTCSPWTFNDQGDAMVVNLAQQTEVIPLTFAEFPAREKWPAILEHARNLAGAEHVGLFGEDEYKTWVAFDFRLYHFTVADDASGSRIAITVDDGSCAPTLLHCVQRHFAALLAPDLSD